MAEGPGKEGEFTLKKDPRFSDYDPNQAMEDWIASESGGDPNEAARLREQAKTDSSLRNFFEHPGQGLTYSTPSNVGPEQAQEPRGVLNEPMSGSYDVRDMMRAMGDKKPGPDQWDQQELSKRATEADKVKQGLTGEPMSGVYKSREGLVEKPQTPQAPKGPTGGK